MKVLFICTGNICRSPMGELLLPQFMPDLESDSAGTRGLGSHEIAPNSKNCSTSMASIPAASVRNGSPRKSRKAVISSSASNMSNARKSQ